MSTKTVKHFVRETTANYHPDTNIFLSVHRLAKYRLVYAKQKSNFMKIFDFVAI